MDGSRDEAVRNFLEVMKELKRLELFKSLGYDNTKTEVFLIFSRQFYARHQVEQQSEMFKLLNQAFEFISSRARDWQVIVFNEGRADNQELLEFLSNQ